MTRPRQLKLGSWCPPCKVQHYNYRRPRPINQLAGAHLSRTPHTLTYRCCVLPPPSGPAQHLYSNILPYTPSGPLLATAQISVILVIMIHPKVHALCLNDKSVSAELAKDPRQEPGEICKKLFHVNIEEDIAEHWKRSHDKDKEPSGADLASALECGKWGGSTPSELFLKVTCALALPPALINLNRSTTTCSTPLRTTRLSMSVLRR